MLWRKAMIGEFGSEKLQLHPETEKLIKEAFSKLVCVKCGEQAERLVSRKKKAYCAKCFAFREVNNLTLNPPTVVENVVSVTSEMEDYLYAEYAYPFEDELPPTYDTQHKQVLIETGFRSYSRSGPHHARWLRNKEEM